MSHNAALSLRALFERTHVRPGGRDELHVMVEVEATGKPIDGVRPALSVVFVLDASGSMNGQPLLQVQQSIHQLVDLLGPEDRVGVVAFASQASTVCALEALSDDARRAIKRRVDAMTAGGQTNLEAGLRLARELLPPRRLHERQVLVVLSDGEANEGVHDAEGLMQMAERMRPDVSVVALGYGARHNPDVLNALAQGGGGQYWFIPDPSQASLEFARAVGAQGDIVAEAVEVVLSPGDPVEIAEVVGARTRLAKGGLVVPLPDLREGAKRLLVARVVVDAPREPQRLDALTARVRYRAAGRGDEHVEVGVPLDVADREPALVPEAYGAAQLARAEVKRAEARAQADRGAFTAAAAMLRDCIAALEAVPGYKKMDGSALSEAVEQLIDEVTAYERRPDAAEYAEFKATQMGVDVLQGGKHQADEASKSQRVSAFIDSVAGVVANGEIVVHGRDGQELARLPLLREVTIGRVTGNDVVLSSGNISKRHARLVVRDGKIIVVDLKTTNGTFVNGRRVVSPIVLQQGDRVQVGDFELEPVIK
jgi:Ca-activated chloride channel family protein